MKFWRVALLCVAGASPASAQQLLLVRAKVRTHVPSIAAKSNDTLRYYLMPLRVGDSYRLSESNPATKTSVRQTVDLTDADHRLTGGADSVIDTWNGVEFVSNPLRTQTQLSGPFSGRLEFRTNKKHFDLRISLYELTSANAYVLLSTYANRWDANGDPPQLRAPTTGAREGLDFQSVRPMSRIVESGSRIVVLITIVKQPDTQINYSTGEDVSDDANEPLTIDWLGDSFVDLPVRD